MKSMLQFIAVASCAVALTACGGGAKAPTAVVTPQPAYKIITDTPGTGATAATGDLVTFTYVGYLYDSTKSDPRGTKVDSSVDVNTSYTGAVGVGAMATGWDQTVLGMQTGGKRTVVMPANMTPYGGNARDELKVNGLTFPAIPVNAPMVYDIQLSYVSKAVTIPNQAPPPDLTLNDIVPGTGTAVVKGNTVTVRYTGWLYDGTRANFKGMRFDDNQATTDQPLPVNVGGTGTITGFNIGIIGMKPGGTRTLIIPPGQGYGAVAQAAGKYGVGIPANSTLVFDVTLISITN